MPTHCCVPWCKQRGPKDPDGNKVSYHRFPRDATLYKKWIIAIKRDEGKFFNVTKCTKVCSRHFLPSDFIPSVSCGNNLLRQTACPSVFSFGKMQQLRKPPKKRTSDSRSAHQIPDQATAQASTVEDSEARFFDDQSTDRSSAAAVGSDTPETEGDTTSCSPAAGTVPSLGGGEPVSEVERLEGVVATQGNEIDRLKYECEVLQEQLLQTKTEMHLSLQENHRLTTRLEETESLTSFCVEHFKHSNEDLLAYTGMPTYRHFLALMAYINPGKNGSNVLRNAGIKASGGRRRTVENELFLVLVRLRLGLFEHDLAHRFGITQSTVSRICVSWINFMYIRLCKLPLWASRAVIDATLPAAFSAYSTTRVILDATEIKCEVPSSLSLQSSSYSAYKSSNTFKGLIGVSPNGLVTFVSELYAGSISDREAVLKSGFLDLKFDGNDSVMADKGFLIEDLLARKNVKLNIPPFLHRNALSEQQFFGFLSFDWSISVPVVPMEFSTNPPAPAFDGCVAEEIWTTQFFGFLSFDRSISVPVVPMEFSSNPPAPAFDGCVAEEISTTQMTLSCFSLCLYICIQRSCMSFTTNQLLVTLAHPTRTTVSGAASFGAVSPSLFDVT
ncbi:uncharacterized protein LOC119454626 [Dermacentor silvarum]|uniref:uncharacterized protein LOC119454626 n=1 Tax=Dermacentor silvarum TaxID=543639 RepID=UPI002100F834|nr:uncharacterized protein LOC119454626 [Dermacentor silvarum]